jgi:hypothetical protein
MNVLLFDLCSGGARRFFTVFDRLRAVLSPFLTVFTVFHGVRLFYF